MLSTTLDFLLVMKTESPISHGGTLLKRNLTKTSAVTINYKLYRSLSLSKLSTGQLKLERRGRTIRFYNRLLFNVTLLYAIFCSFHNTVNICLMYVI